MSFLSIVRRSYLLYSHYMVNKSISLIKNMSDEKKGPDDGQNGTPTNGPWGAPKGPSKNPKGNRSPWGSGPFQDPNQNKKLEETLEKLQKGFRDSFMGNKGGGNGLRGTGSSGNELPGKGTILFGLVIILLLWLSTGFFRVQENEMAVVMRFGKVVRHVSPGLQYHIPYPIENVIKQDSTVRVFEENIRKDQMADYTPTMILTGDENMVICNYRVRWRIKNITEFLFTARNPESTIKAAAESATREVIGQTLSHLALTTDQDKIAARVQTSLQGLLDQYKIGVEIREFNMLGVIPPAEVVDSFNDLQASKADASQEINKAESYQNDIIPRARGAAVQIIQESEGARDAKIAVATGEASLFKQIYDAFEQNKSIAVKRYYLDTMKEVLSHSKVIVFDPKANQGVVPYLPLNELPKRLDESKITEPQGGQK